MKKSFTLTGVVCAWLDGYMAETRAKVRGGKRRNVVAERYSHLATQESFQFALHVATVAVLVAVMVTMVSQTFQPANRGRVAGSSDTSIYYR